MQRTAPLRFPKVDSLDFMVVLAMAVVPFAYYLGFNLDWSQQAQLEPFAPAPFEAESRALDHSTASLQATLAYATTPGADLQEDFPAWDEMVRQLESEAITYPGTVAIYLKDLKHDRTWTYRADDLFRSASLVKVPIMVAVFDKVHRGELSLQTRIPMRRRDRVGGSGMIKWYPDGTMFTVQALLEHMINESDNTAAHMLISATGFDYLQREFPNMGLTHTTIYPEGMSLRSNGVQAENENYTTAREMSMLLEKIYRGDMIDPYSSELMLEFLKHHHTKARLAKRLPTGWEIAHKTGLLRGACHDSAIIFTPHGDYVLTVLTGENRSYGRAKDFITRLGRITYTYYKTADQLFAKRTGAGAFD